MNGIGLTTSPGVELISAYVANIQEVPAVASPPGWYVVGAFYLPTSTPARLEAIGAVSDAALTMNVRLFDLTDGAPVSGSDVTIRTLIDSRETSGVFTMTGGRAYQVQVQVTGGSGTELFGALKSASPIA